MAAIGASCTDNKLGTASDTNRRRKAREKLPIVMTDTLPFSRLEMLDQAGVDQEPVEAPRLLAAGAGVEQALAAFEDFLLLGERGVERQTGALLDDQREIGRLDRV